MWNVAWSVKVSKLCNLRCRYCYEWDDLSDPHRLSMADWAKVIVAARTYHERMELRLGEPGRTRFYWHGGEPLVLPIRYFEEVLRLQKTLLGEGLLHRSRFSNFLQTNLYSLPESKLDLLSRERFDLGVSFDLVRGQRLDISGDDTQERVGRNMRRLRDRGVPFAGAVVLTAPTAARIEEIHDHYAGMGVRFTIFALSPSPAPAAESVSLDGPEVQAAFRRLYLHWMARGMPIAIQPLTTYVETVLLHLAGLRRPVYDRQITGDRRFVVATNGDLFTLADRYVPEMHLGNVFQKSIDDIVASARYADSLDADSRRRVAHCDGCEFRGACDTYPLFSEVYRNRRGRCRTAHDLMQFIEGDLRGRGVTPERLRSIADWGDVASFDDEIVDWNAHGAAKQPSASPGDQHHVG